MRLTLLTPATPAYAALEDLALGGPAYPTYYAPVVVTGLPGYGSYAVPLYLVVTAAGLGFFDLEGYALGGTPVLPASVAGPIYASAVDGEAAAFYYAALGVAAALPSRLTYSAVTSALGTRVFEDLPAPTFSSGSLYA